MPTSVMTEGDSYARPFKKGDWYEVTATGYDNKGKKLLKQKLTCRLQN